MSLIGQPMPEISGVSKLLWTDGHPVVVNFSDLLLVDWQLWRHIVGVVETLLPVPVPVSLLAMLSIQDWFDGQSDLQQCTDMRNNMLVGSRFGNSSSDVSFSWSLTSDATTSLFSRLWKLVILYCVCVNCQIEGVKINKVIEPIWMSFLEGLSVETPTKRTTTTSTGNRDGTGGMEFVHGSGEAMKRWTSCISSFIRCIRVASLSRASRFRHLAVSFWTEGKFKWR